MTEEEKIEEWPSPDGSFTKLVHSKGVGFFAPIDGAICKIQILSDLSNLICELDNNNMKEITIGEADNFLNQILESCLYTMKEDEISTLVFSGTGTDLITPVKENVRTAKYLEDIEELKSPVTEIKTPSTEENKLKEDWNNVKDKCVINEDDKKTDYIDSSKIKFKLISFNRQPEIFEMSVTEKWRRATHHKERGVELFAQGEYKYAFRRFSTALKYLISVEQDIPPERMEDDINVKGLKLSCYLNLGACHLKKPNYEAVVKVCTKALELDAYSAKALYRRGSAYIQLQDYEKAKEDLNQAAQLEPKNAAIVKQQQLLKARVQKLNKYYAKTMKKLFA